VNDAQLLADRFEEHRGRLEAVAYRMLGQAMLFRRFALDAHFAMINGEVGVVGVHDGRPMSVMGVTVTGAGSPGCTSWPIPSGWPASICRTSPAEPGGEVPCLARAVASAAKACPCPLPGEVSFPGGH
jgi:hypothetical protein